MTGGSLHTRLRYAPGRSRLHLLTGLLPIFLTFLLTFLLSCDACKPAEREDKPENDALARPTMVTGERPLMGTRFEIQLLSREPVSAAADIEEALDALERLEAGISEWREDSEISLLNQEAGRRPVRVGPELFEIIQRSGEISSRTDGAFDITFASCGQHWSFRDRRIPTAEELAACLPLVDYRGISLSPETGEVYLPSGVTIGIGAVGKGYGVDYAAAFLEARGYHTYLIDGGGDIRVRGDDPERTWTLGIRHPLAQRDADGQPPVQGSVTLRQGALAGSGDYEQYFEQDGERYHHILDPSTGMPARASVAVHVIAPSSLEADAYATAFFVLGGERAMEIADDHPGVEAWVMEPSHQIHVTAGFQHAYQDISSEP